MTKKEMMNTLRDLIEETNRKENSMYKLGIHYAIGWIVAAEFKDADKVLEQLRKEAQ